MKYLLSRHGINADEETIQQKIMTNLAGDLSSDPSHVIDIAQLASMLLLPHLKKIADSNDEEQIQILFGNGLELLLSEIMPDPRWYPHGYVPGARPALSADLLQEVLALHGEFDVPPQILEDMVHVAGGDHQTLDLANLIKATTSDLTLYDVARENVASTHYEDATSSSIYESHKMDATMTDEEENAKDTVNVHKLGAEALSRQFTASNIDLTAETYASKIWVALVWMVAILVFFALYVSQNMPKDSCL